MSFVNESNIEELLRGAGGAIKNACRDWDGVMSRLALTDEEVMQQVALKAREKLEEFEAVSQAQFSAWAKTVAARWLRDQDEKGRPEPGGDGIDPADAVQSPSSFVGSCEKWEAYRSAIGRLAPHQRVLLDLFHLQGLTMSEVKERLEKDYPALWSEHRASWDTEAKLYRATAKARDALRLLLLEEGSDLFEE